MCKLGLYIYVAIFGVILDASSSHMLYPRFWQKLLAKAVNFVFKTHPNQITSPISMTTGLIQVTIRSCQDAHKNILIGCIGFLLLCNISPQTSAFKTTQMIISQFPWVRSLEMA